MYSEPGHRWRTARVREGQLPILSQPRSFYGMFREISDVPRIFMTKTSADARQL